MRSERLQPRIRDAGEITAAGAPKPLELPASVERSAPPEQETRGKASFESGCFSRQCSQGSSLPEECFFQTPV